MILYLKEFNLRSLGYIYLFASFTSHAGIMRDDISFQDYRDFSENLGKYKPGAINTPVFRKDGSLDQNLDFPLPDFGAVMTTGNGTLFSPSYFVSARHVSGFNVSWGNKAKYATTYNFINRNDSPSADFNIPRLSKVVTESAPIESISKDELKTADVSRFPWFARTGAGVRKIINDDRKGFTQLPGGYLKTGGLMSGEKMTLDTMIRWKNNFSTPLSQSAQSGDSGSGVLVFDTLDQKWKIAGVVATAGGTGVYVQTNSTYIQDQFVASVFANNTAPDVTDSASGGVINWTADSISQGENMWLWYGLDPIYASQAPSKASNAELDATKDLRFNGSGGDILLAGPINMGAGKLQFSNNYRLASLSDMPATWVGGGVEVDQDNTVLWQVNGLKGDALHKIGAGTLHVNASGINHGALNVGDGTVILDQQADENGAKQAFSTVTLVSGRPTVVLNDSEQVDSQNILFGYRGGTLDLNGNDLTFNEIKHNDNGARIVNRNASQAALITFTGDNQTFLGELGDAQSRDQLNVQYQPADENGHWTLAGGAQVNELVVEKGKMQLDGQQVLHADKVLFSDDWDEKSYHVNALHIESGADLTVGEHATLDTTANVASNASLSTHARSVINGSIELLSHSAKLLADIAPRISTVGELATQINAKISGLGTLTKTGKGRLILNGDVTTQGNVALDEGELEVNGNMTSPLLMASQTLLSGYGSLNQVTSGEGSTIAPGYNNQWGEWSTMRINTLSAGSSSNVVLNSAFTSTTTDRLLIDGDMTNTDEGPVMVNINPLAGWINTDDNNNGVADSGEGISVIQVGGKARADSFKLKGEYVAKGPWAYALYAFAPGKSAEEERLVNGEGNQYWDYRLQNILLSESDNTTPVGPKPAPVTVPEVAPAPVPEVVLAPEPEVAPAPVPEVVHTPVPEAAPVPSYRPAVIPQIPTYISMPSAFLRFDENLQSLFKTSALEAGDDGKANFFLSGYNGEDQYHTAGEFMTYGYDFTSEYRGWMMGAHLPLITDAQQKAGLTLGINKGTLSLTPHARDGASNGHFDTWGLSGLLNRHQENGLMLDMPFGYSHVNGEVSTNLRGKVASQKAKNWHIGMDLGWGYQYGNHRITPVVGALYQNLDIKRFQDSDGANVRYQMHPAPQVSAGAKYEYQNGRLLNLGSELRVVHRSDKNHDVIVSDGARDAYFASGNGGKSIQWKGHAGIQLSSNIELTSQLQYQKRLHKEGTDDWSIMGGVKVTF